MQRRKGPIIADPQSLLDQLQSYEDRCQELRKLFEQDGVVDANEQELLDRINGIIATMRRQLSRQAQAMPARAESTAAAKQVAAAAKSGFGPDRKGDSGPAALAVDVSSIPGLGEILKELPGHIVDLLKKLVDPRVCVITVDNSTNALIFIGNVRPESGGFATLPPKRIEPKGSARFIWTNRQDSPAGAAGEMDWIVGPQTNWLIKWNNPRGGKTSGDAKITGDSNPDSFVADTPEVGVGNVAQFRFTLLGGPSGHGTTGGDREGFTVLVRNKESGAPLPGVKVTVGDQTDTTSTEGLATVELPVGSHAYQAVKEGFESAKGKAEIIAGDNPELILELAPAKDQGPREGLSIVVEDADTGKAIAKAAVKIGDQSDTTSPLGLATVELPVGKHKYEVTAKDYDSERGEHEIIQGDNPEFIVKLKPQGGGKTETLTVVVKDKKSGDAIKDANVTVGGKSDVTSERGLATLKLPAGKHSYEVSAESYQPAKGSVEVVEGDNDELVVELEKLDDFKPPSEADEPTLRKGDDNVDGWVEYLQKLLNHQLGAGAAPEHGNFDQKTYDAVKKFQASTNPPCMVDGIVGNETWSALREDPKRAAVGTDGREPHTFVETGPEARWGTESKDILSYDRNSDELRLVVMSVGDKSVDEFEADVFVNGKRHKIKIGAPEIKSPTGAGHAHWVRVTKFVKTHGAGPHDIEAFLPQELGGDKWTTKGLVLPNGGTGGKKGAVLVSVSLNHEPVESASVTMTPAAGGKPFKGKTDEEGNVDFKDVPVGKYAVEAVDPESGARGGGPVDVDPGTNIIDVALKSGRGVNPAKKTRR